MDIPSIFTTAVGIVGSILALFGSIFLFGKYVLLMQYRLRATDIRNFHEWITNSSGMKILLSEEIIRNKSMPCEFRGLIRIRKHPFMFVNLMERLLTAGWTSKESVGYLYCFRWSGNRVRHLLDTINQTTDQASASYILRPWSEDRIGSLSTGQLPVPVMQDETLTMIEDEIKRCLAGEINKTGILLHGPPGTGKSMLVRYLAMKFGLSIKLALFKPDYGNDDILTMFAGINDSPSIVLLEDFDSVFDRRKILLGTTDSPAKFSFDSVLNVLDGVHNSYRNTIFILTVNDIEKVDPAIRYRPSRIRFIKEMHLPDEKVRMSILQDQELVHWTSGCNLDIVFMVKQQYDSGVTLESIRAQIQERMNTELPFMTDRGPIA